MTIQSTIQSNCESDVPVFYSLIDTPLFILISPDGTFVVEAPGLASKKESTLRVFTVLRDAITYKMQGGYGDDSMIRKTTLVGLWALLGHINGLSIAKWAVPIRVEASSFNGSNEIYGFSTLHSQFLVLN